MLLCHSIFLSVTMTLLLDTHALIWALYDPGKLPTSLRSDLTDSMVPVCYSSVSALEISVKIAIGKLTLDIRQLISEAEKIGFREAPFRARHAAQMVSLPALHSDPFDRALVAQASLENFIFVTRDKAVRGYPIIQRWE